MELKQTSYSEVPAEELAKWLDDQGIAYAFHDFRADGLKGADVERWAATLGWESLLNRRSTTWRELPDGEKENLDGDKAVALMVANPTLIKRPVFVGNGLILNGFTDAVRARLG